MSAYFLIILLYSFRKILALWLTFSNILKYGSREKQHVLEIQ